jgi:hypothetical protein
MSFQDRHTQPEARIVLGEAEAKNIDPQTSYGISAIELRFKLEYHLECLSACISFDRSYEDGGFD